ncbi:MAG: hypothetical protein HYS87_03180 [Candidatus Colwellbacteria bacterium]|nr:hypothetical protein [Candidatus Colwellbacteria bacterium]
MRLTEFEGKELFNKYSIPIPKGILINNSSDKITLSAPFVLKAQVLSGDRKYAGGIIFVNTKRAAKSALKKLFHLKIKGEVVKRVLAEEKLNTSKEFYVSFSYDTSTKMPVLALSTAGGTGAKKAKIFPIDIVKGLPQFVIRGYLKDAKFKSEDISKLAGIISNLWHLFIKEYALLAEINPLIKTKEGEFIAGDSKIIIDDAKVRAGERRLIDLGGDIAILASGGGASMLNIDALASYGGRPANYTEYSGNPPANVVRDLTYKVLSRRGLKGCWVVGGTANFTDIYETIKGFAEGLKMLKPKPKYPIVIRRDGPRQKEAKKMILKLAEREGYQIYFFDSETPMAETAKLIVKLAYGNSNK